MSQVVSHVIASIGPASEASGEAARARVAGAGAPMLERLAYVLAAAQHTSRPRGSNRRILVAAGDHGAGDPGIAMGADHPTVIAARAIADGTAALCHVARSAATPIVVVDAGVREPTHMPGIAVQLGRGPSRNLIDEPAMTVVDAALGLEAGIALAMSLSEDGLDLLALGALGVGSEVASAALLGAATGRPVTGLRDDVAEAAAARGASYVCDSGQEQLAMFGGPETALLAGVIVGCASINVPVILDGYATGAAALIAAALAPPVTGYLVAAHRGTFTMPAILAHLGLEPIFDVGLGHGEGTGAAMVLPLVDQVAAFSA